MSIRIIRTGNDPVLREKARPVPVINKAIEKLLTDMAQTMYDAEGIGLAANQVGIAKRIVVVDVGQELIELVNPEIVDKSEDQARAYEGCLSLPGLRGQVTRPAEITVRYMDRHGETHEIHAKDLLARCIQHEVDHLDGILFTDYIPPDEIEQVREEKRSSAND